MKTLSLAVLVFVGTICGHAQGTVNFQNITGTGAGNVAAITNFWTGGRVPSGTAFLVQLYYGAPGTATDSLVPAGPAVNFIAPGFFAGGTRTLDAAVIGDCTQGSRQATLQVRAWEAVLGPDWDTAYRTLLRGDCLAVIGESATFTVTTGNPCAMPPGTPANLVELKGFGLYPPVGGSPGNCPEPASFALAILGLGGFALVRGHQHRGSK